MRLLVAKPSICAIAALIFIARPASGELAAQPTGILRFNNQTFALFEEYSSRPGRFHGTIRVSPAEPFSLSSGKKALVERIETDTGDIYFQIGGSNQVARIKSDLPANQPGVALGGANVDQLIAVYGFVAKTNVILHPDLPATKFTFTAQFADPESAVKKLREQLAEAEVVLLPFSENIEAVVPQRLAATKFDRAKYLKSKRPDSRLQPGTLELSSSPIDFPIQICANMLDIENEPPPRRKFHISTARNPLSLFGSDGRSMRRTPAFNRMAGIQITCEPGGESSCRTCEMIFERRGRGG
jgi:hypothetical protein